MGFESPTPTYRVEFDDTSSYPGFWCRVSGMSITEALEFARSDARLVEAFAQRLVEWNLEADSRPVPVDSETVLRQDANLILSAAVAWYKRITKPEPTRQATFNGAGGGSPLGQLANLPADTPI